MVSEDLPLIERDTPFEKEGRQREENGHRDYKVCKYNQINLSLSDGFNFFQ